MTEALALPGGARLVLAGAEGWSERAGLPAFSVGSLPGAQVVLDVARTHGELLVRVGCVTAPTDRWAPGLEDTIFGYATWIAHKSLGPAPIRLAGGTVTATSPAGGPPSHFRQPLASADPAWSVEGWHELGFVGAPSMGLVCSLVCAERAGLGGCGELAAASHVEASFGGEPPPSLVVRALLWTADRPQASAALVALLGLAAATSWIRSRPR